jgi:uncharacterized membrane protein YgdD (TMEM256/DUF423 family)
MRVTAYTKNFLFIASLMMALAIAIGAFGAHGLKAHVDESLLKIYQTGVQYHFYNTLGLFAIAFLSYLMPNSKKVIVSGYVLFLGTIIFAFSLYALVLMKLSWLGAITPIGGVLMIIAWLMAAYSLKDLNVECH